MYLSLSDDYSTAAQGLHMQVIAAVVVGGVNIFRRLWHNESDDARRDSDGYPGAEPHPDAD